MTTETKPAEIIYIGTTTDTYAVQLLKNLSVYNEIKLALFDKYTGKKYHPNEITQSATEESGKIFKTGIILKLYYLLRSNLRLHSIVIRSRNTTTFHILYLEIYHVLLFPYFLFSKKKLILTFYGTDLMEAKRRLFRILYLPVVKCASQITFLNDQYNTFFSSIFKKKYNSKIKVIRFGLSNLKHINELRNISKNELNNIFNFPENKLCITCGTYGGNNNNQQSILEELRKLPSNNKEKIHLIFPCTYGSSKHDIEGLEKKLIASGFSFTLLKNHLNNKEIAALRLMSTILIHLPNHDQLSASMVETLYAGGQVITGSWLPYDVIQKNGVELNLISSFSELNKRVTEIISQQSIPLKNSEQINKLFSWEANIAHWRMLYS